MSPNLARITQPAPRMIVPSQLLGELTVDPDELFHFPAGLFGFPDSRDFVLLPAEQEGYFWLQSTAHAALAFLLADPFHFFDGYAVEIGTKERRDLGDPGREELLVLAIVTLPRKPDGRPTANLQGPIALNLHARLARQLPVADGAFGVREEFDGLCAASRWA